MATDPVTDWATDFDHTDDRWAADPFPIWDDLRSACPVARTERYGGAWLPTTHADVTAIANDSEHFTSRSVIVSGHRPPVELAPAGIAPPISADPPFHAASRRMLLPVFSPQRIAELEPSTRAYCNELLDGVRGRDVVDAAVDYAQHIPVRVIARMLGLPDEDGDRFRGFVEGVIEAVADPREERIETFLGLLHYLSPYIEARQADPQDDVISLLLASDIDGEPLDPLMVVRTIGLLLIAGIDTTWSAIGASIWHLAATPADRRRLVDEPALIPTAIEELLRAYAPVTMARLVKQDVTLAGCPMEAEDWVLLPFPAANRDPAFFDRADEVLLDRSPNRHAAFGLGMHRCAGSHLARMELRVALEEWLRAFPDFSLADGDAVRWSGGQVRGPRTPPVRVAP
ncbi:cytochrome P450 [Iamia majanohamensis]|uniref:Cytochrome P450 n=1 Tax=Iamia majanohamensis TaxID=467976 RepID=A0AAE9YB35_9ACTN|nr:cytochrome P450 [Iamia majanohamensis]WCO65747.1 cytochrome P450 [Iamia majanohamensis]